MNHKELVDYLFEHPDKIEEGFRCVFKEFWFGKGRIDILGVDKNGVVTTVEVKVKVTQRSLRKAELQARHYRSQMSKFFRIFGISKPVRCILWTPKGVFDLGKREPDFRVEVLDIPTSRELFGLRKAGGERSWQGAVCPLSLES